MSTYAIGDIQGCYKQLRKLLNKVKSAASTDTLWCVGDLINRWSRPLATLKFSQDIDDSTRIVFANQSLHLNALYEAYALLRGHDT